MTALRVPPPFPPPRFQFARPPTGRLQGFGGRGKKVITMAMCGTPHAASCESTMSGSTPGCSPALPCPWTREEQSVRAGRGFGIVNLGGQPGLHPAARSHLMTNQVRPRRVNRLSVRDWPVPRSGDGLGVAVRPQMQLLHHLNNCRQAAKLRGGSARIIQPLHPYRRYPADTVSDIPR